MERVVLKIGKNEFEVTAERVKDRHAHAFKVTVCAWLGIPLEDWSSCIVSVATVGKPEQHYCTTGSALYDDIKSWLIEGCLPTNRVTSPMVVSVVTTSAPKRGAKRAGSAATSNVTAMTDDNIWEENKGNFLHVTTEMQKVVQAVGEPWYSDLKGVVGFLQTPDCSFIQPMHITSLDKLYGRSELVIMVQLKAELDRRELREANKNKVGDDEEDESEEDEDPGRPARAATSKETLMQAKKAVENLSDAFKEMIQTLSADQNWTSSTLKGIYKLMSGWNTELAAKYNKNMAEYVAHRACKVAKPFKRVPVTCPGKGDRQLTRANWALMEGKWIPLATGCKTITHEHTAPSGAVAGSSMVTRNDQTADSPIAKGKGGAANLRGAASVADGGNCKKAPASKAQGLSQMARAGAKRKMATAVQNAVLEDSEDELGELAQPPVQMSHKVRAVSPKQTRNGRGKPAAGVRSIAETAGSEDELLGEDDGPETTPASPPMATVAARMPRKSASAKTPATEVGSNRAEARHEDGMRMGAESSSIMEHTSMQVQPVPSKAARKLQDLKLALDEAMKERKSAQKEASQFKEKILSSKPKVPPKGRRSKKHPQQAELDAMEEELSAMCKAEATMNDQIEDLEADLGGR